MFCKNCGTQLEDGARFCRICGTPTATETAVNTVTPAEPLIRTAPSDAVSLRQKHRIIECWIVLIVMLGAWLAGILFLMDDEEEIGTPFFLIGLVLFYVWMLRYMICQAFRNVRWLKKRGKAGVGADIVLKPGARLCCGQEAFFESKQCLLIPYADVIWVFQRKIYFLMIPVVSRLMVRTIDGKVFQLKAKPEEFSQIYDRMSAKFPQNLLLGATKENTKAYREIRRAYKNQMQ